MGGGRRGGGVLDSNRLSPLPPLTPKKGDTGSLLDKAGARPRCCCGQHVIMLSVLILSASDAIKKATCA